MPWAVCQRLMHSNIPFDSQLQVQLPSGALHITSALLGWANFMNALPQIVSQSADTSAHIAGHRSARARFGLSYQSYADDICMPAPSAQGQCVSASMLP